MAYVNPVEVQKYLSGLDYPASKEEIMRHARSEGADDDIIEALEDLPSREYETPAEISKALSEAE